MMMYQETSNTPGQIEAALQYLRFAEEIQSPRSFDCSSHTGRELTKTEFEVKDSALTMLLEYFNQPVPQPGPGNSGKTPSAFGQEDELPL